MPAGISDGALIVDTGLNNAGFFRDARRYSQAIESLKNRVNRVGQEMGKSGDGYMRAVRNNLQANKKFQAEIRGTEAEAKRLKAAMNELGGKRLATDALQKNRREVAKLTEQWEKLRDKAELAQLMDNSKAFSSYTIQMDQVLAKVRELRAEREQLKVQGNAFVYGRDTEAYRQMNQQYNEATQKLREMRQVRDEVGSGFQVVMRQVGATAASLGRLAGMAGSGALSFLRKLASGAKNAAIQLAKLAGRALVNGIRKIGQYAASATKSLLRMGRAAKQSGGGFQFSLKNLLKYGLGIRSMFVLFNRLRSAVTEGFKALSDSDPRVRSSLASLKAALGGLKGSLAGAFSPILTAVAPALTTFINLLTGAINTVGMFMAALTGQGYYYAAKGIGNVGSSAKSSSGKVKELKRQLAGFDELNILAANDGGGSSGGGSGSDVDYTYSKLPIESSIAKFVDQLKALAEDGDWEGVGKVLADGINGAFDKAQRLISWDRLGDKLTDAMQAITGTINGLVRNVDWANIGATVGEGLNTITNTLLLWYEGIDWAAIGKGFGKALNGLFERVNWTNLGKLLSKKAGSLIAILKNALTTIEWGNAGRRFANALNGFFKNEDLWKDAGAAINAALKGLLDFTQKFVITFDPTQAAKDIRTALGQIQWGDIASSFWTTAKLAFKKAGDFLTVLLGGEVQDFGITTENALSEKLAIKNGRTTSGSWAQNLGLNVGKAIKWVLGKITEGVANFDWYGLGEDFKAGLDAMDWVGIKNKLFKLVESLFEGLGDFIAGVFLENTLLGDNWLNKLIDFLMPGTVDKAKDVVKSLGGVESAYGMYKDYKKNQDKVDKGENYVAPEKGPIQITFANGILKENTEAIDDNTKITKTKNDELTQLNRDKFSLNGGDLKGWDAIYRTQKDRDTFAANGGDLKGWDDLFNEEQTVDVSINFIPEGAKKYANKVPEYMKRLFAPGSDTDARVNLVRQGWTSIAQFVGTAVQVAAMLFNGNYTTLNDFVGHLISAGVNLFNGNFTTLNDFVGHLIQSAVNLFNGNYTSLNDFVGHFIRSTVNLFNGNYTSLNDFVGWLINAGVNLFNGNFWSLQDFIGYAVDAGVHLYKGNYWSLQDFVGSWINTAVYLTNQGTNWSKGIVDWITNGVDAVKLKVSLIANAVTVAASNKASGGIITAGGHSLNFAGGGIIKGGVARWLSGVPHYAGGTAQAHGTVFVAGEAGPEIMGHINGRTEILNRSQLAQTMQAAVYNGMVAALRGITFKVPAVAAGSVLPYEVSAQIAKSTADIQGTLDANNEDLIQTIISVAGQIVAAIQRSGSTQQPSGSGSVTAQQIIDQINQRTQMFSASPLTGV